MSEESVEDRRERVAALYAQSENKSATAISKAAKLPFHLVYYDLRTLKLVHPRERALRERRGPSLTERRREVLREFLRREEVREPPPTLRELARRFGGTSSHAQYEVLQLLRGMGYLEGRNDATSRAFRLTSAGREEARAGRDPIGSALDALREALAKRKLTPLQVNCLARDLRKLRERVEAVPA